MLHVHHQSGGFLVGGRTMVLPEFQQQVVDSLGLAPGEPLIVVACQTAASAVASGVAPVPGSVAGAAHTASALAVSSGRPVVAATGDVFTTADGRVVTANAGFDVNGVPVVTGGESAGWVIAWPDGTVTEGLGPDLLAILREGTLGSHLPGVGITAGAQLQAPSRSVRWTGRLGESSQSAPGPQGPAVPARFAALVERETSGQVTGGAATLRWVADTAVLSHQRGLTLTGIQGQAERLARVFDTAYPEGSLPGGLTGTLRGLRQLLDSVRADGGVNWRTASPQETVTALRNLATDRFGGASLPALVEMTRAAKQQGQSVRLSDLRLLPRPPRRTAGPGAAPGELPESGRTGQRARVVEGFAGALGFEAELGGFRVRIEPDSEPEDYGAIVTLPGLLKIVLDSGAGSDPVLEVVTDPARVLDGAQDDGRAELSDVVAAYQDVLRQLRAALDGDRSAVRLSDVFRAEDGYQVSAEARGLQVRHGPAATVLVHFTTAIPLSGMTALMRHVGLMMRRGPGALQIARDDLDAALSYAHGATGHYDAWLRDNPDQAAVSDPADRAELEGALALGFTQAAAAARGRLRGEARVRARAPQAKDSTAVVSRESLRAIRSGLGPAHRAFLEQQAERLRGGFTSAYAGRPGITTAAPLDLSLIHGEEGQTVGDYFDNLLTGGEQEIDQDALDVTTKFDQLDGNPGTGGAARISPRVVRVELRHYAPANADEATIAANARTLAGVSVTQHNQVRQARGLTPVGLPATGADVRLGPAGPVPFGGQETPSGWRLPVSAAEDPHVQADEVAAARFFPQVRGASVLHVHHRGGGFLVGGETMAPSVFSRRVIGELGLAPGEPLIVVACQTAAPAVASGVAPVPGSVAGAAHTASALAVSSGRPV
ncbi:MAG TPA: hypothetical protein VHT94_00135, partial [Streptosporangiaceae bacterium]|nr:hypothetical protein [Streptosporangiaceae bacterium]